jgi:predicted RNA methylase
MRHPVEGYAAPKGIPPNSGSGLGCRAIPAAERPQNLIANSVLDPPAVLARLGLRLETASAVEFGCGYGTFTFPAAWLTHGPIYAFDMEPGMVEMVSNKARQRGLRNVVCEVREAATVLGLHVEITF